MRKIFLFLFLLVPLYSLFAQWDQAIIPLDDPIYQKIEYLYRMEGIALPTAVYPWTRLEARVKLEQFPSSDLADSILQDLAHRGGTLGASTYSAAIPLALSLDLQGNFLLAQEGEPLEVYPSTRNAGDRNNFLEIPFCFSLLDDRLYMEVNLNFREDLNSDWETPQNFSNLPLYYYDVDLTFPQSAYISTGGEHWNVLLGRTPQNWGRGKTGNLLLADNAYFYEQIRFKTNYENFNFTWTAINLDPRITPEQAAEYVPGNDPEPEVIDAFVDEYQYTYGPQKFLFLHDFEFKPHKSLRIGLTEGLILGGLDFSITPLFLNPMMMFHNWFTNISNQGNGIHMIEVDWNYQKQLYYFQFCLDQFQSSSEKERFPYAAFEPNAFGILTGINRMQSLYDGILSITFEGAWTMPYLYTAHGYYDNHSINEYHASNNIFVRTLPMGYYLGNDAIVIALMGEYFSSADWSLQTELRLIWDGEKDMNTAYPYSGAATEEDSEQLFPSGLVNSKALFAMKGRWKLSPHWELEGGNLLIFQENPHPYFEENNGDRYKTTLWAMEPWISMRWTL